MTYLSAAEITKSYKRTDWQYKCFSEFDMAMRSKVRPFPCLRGVMGHEAGHLRFCFFDDLASAEFAQTLEAYLKEARNFGCFTSLVAFEKPSSLLFLKDYHKKFWDCLKQLNGFDKVAWPDSIPAATDNEKWEFCFSGEPVFVVCNTPAHILRRSRYASSFMMTFQPCWVFANLLDTKQKANKEFALVSTRLKLYDHVPKSPYLGRYGDKDIFESEQYFLSDGNRKMGCPYKNLSDSQMIAEAEK